MNIKFEIPGRYWAIKGSESMIDLGHCKDVEELSREVRRMIDAGADDLDWTGWKTSLDVETTYTIEIYGPGVEMHYTGEQGEKFKTVNWEAEHLSLEDAREIFNEIDADALKADGFKGHGELTLVIRSCPLDENIGSEIIAEKKIRVPYED